MSLTSDMLNNAIKQMKVADTQKYRCYINDKEMEMLCKHFGLEYYGQQEMNIRNMRFIVADLNMPIADA
jgi:hypothetical protein